MSSLKLEHIPVLEGAKNYAEWAKALRYSLLGEDLWTYITEGKDIMDLVSYGIVKPQITTLSGPDEIAAARTFMVNDAKANSVIRRRLSPLISASIPTSCDDSARDTWNHLKSAYGKTDINVQFALRSQLLSLRMWDSSDTDRYVSEFNIARERLVATGATYSDEEAVHQIMLGIPDTGTWGVFKQVTLSAIGDAAAALHPLALTSIVSRIEAEGQRTRMPTKQPGPGSEYANVARESGGIRKHKGNPDGVPCTNPICQAKGKLAESHDIAHCWQTRGRMEGRKPEWMVLRDKARVETRIQLAQHTASRPTLAPTQSSSTTWDLQGSGQTAHFEGDLLCAMIEPAVDVSFLAQHLLAVLMDSGTTSHLIKDRQLFWSFDPSGATAVRTANHGVLNTCGRGDRLVAVRYGSKRTQLKLRDCLHAPDAVINLFSVGRMVAADLRVRFEDNRLQILLPNFTKLYEHPLKRLLGFVDVEFIPPPCHPLYKGIGDSSNFSRVMESADLWHARLGHAGGAASRLIGNCAEGVSGNTGQLSVCEACIVGKHRHCPHPSSSSRATKPLTLVQCLTKPFQCLVLFPSMLYTSGNKITKISKIFVNMLYHL
jgi:hypothetical protein